LITSLSLDNHLRDLLSIGGLYRDFAKGELNGRQQRIFFLNISLLGNELGDF
jgi:hypothetical protein